ncbi:uncharacterized protein DUF4192 [Microterricola gilva]|uniref:Uncharacterized protein DUF4192 n=1 Tax=Microterricola gilva TaxID=393267 RepID=A0A4Q8AKT9_9MICO|nr:DUF4192 family protein [Microterricola gilva]RZU64495.1 uncharacterized protein DUF4192 [Microterricola gilva]
MTTIITARDGQDLLALVPELAGFRPVESLVLVAFRGKRSCGALRADLPHSSDADVLSAVASSLIGLLCKIPEADAVVPLVYTSARFDAGNVPPHGEAMNAVIFHAEESGFLVRDALCVAADGWASYLDTAVPPGGHALALIAESTVTAQLAAERPPGAPADRAMHDQRGPDPRRTADLVTRQRMGRLINRFRAMASDPAALGEPSAELAALLGLPAVAEMSVNCPAETVSELDAAALLFAMQGPPARDMLLIHWAFGVEAGARAERENLRFAAGEPGAGRESAALFWGEGPRPDPERIEAAIELLLELVARAPRRCKPPALSMLAWLNWALGRSSRAAVFIEMALAIDPGYGLAEILETMLSIGRLPEWAFAVPVAAASAARHDGRTAETSVRSSAGRSARRAGRRAAQRGRG